MIRNRRGFSFIELIVTFCILMLVIGGALMTIQTINRSTTSLTMMSRLNLAMQSVMDGLRYRSISEFTTMEWSTPKVEIDNDGIYITSTVGPVEADRTRLITLYGEERRGNGAKTSKSMEARLSQVRGQAKSRIRVLVKNEATGEGLYRVDLKAKGQSAPFVTAQTDIYGYATLEDVYLSAVGVTMTINGEGIPVGNGGPCYFPTGPTTGKFAKDFPSPSTMGSPVIDLTGSPYMMACSGVIKGRVMDPIINEPVPGYEVLIHNKPGGLRVIPNPTLGTRSAVTDAEGYFNFSGVIPGYWGVYGVGKKTSNQYIAITKPGSIYSNLSSDFVNVVPAATTTCDLQTTRMGSLTNAKVFYANGWNAVSKKFTDVTTPIPNARLLLSRLSTAVDVPTTPPSPPGSITFSFLDTTAWNERIKFESDSNPFVTMTDGVGTFSKLNYAPRFLHSSFPLATQFGKVSVVPDHYQPATATPILVVNPTDTPWLAIRYGVSTSEVDLRPGNASLAPPKLYATTLSANQSVTDAKYYFLHASMLGQVKGKVNFSGPPPTCVTKSVAIHRGSLANSGGVDFTGGWARVQRDFYVTPDGAWDYDTGRTVIPNLGTDQTQLDFECKTANVAVTKNLQGTVYPYTKIFESGAIKRVIVANPTDLTFSTLEFYKAGASAIAFTMPSVSVTGSGININPNQFDMISNYKVSAAPITVDPGSTLTNINLSVPASGTPVYADYDLRPTLTTSPNWVFAWTGSTKGPRFGLATDDIYRGKDVNQVFIFNRILNGTISGSVKNAVGESVNGIKMTLKRSGFSTDLVYMTVEDACPSCSGGPKQYIFSNFKFTASLGTNFTLSVYDAGGVYQPQTLYREGYDNYDQPWDIVLTKVAVPTGEGM